MTDYLPLFPLSLVVYPGEKLKLHIFEPRYRELISDCLSDQITFGIPSVINRKLGNFATEVSLVSIDKRYETGEMDITTRGARRARVEHFYDKASHKGKLYPAGDIQWLKNIDDPEVAAQQRIMGLMEELHQNLGISRRIVSSSEQIRAFRIAHHIGLNIRQEYLLLSMNRESERLAYIEQHLEKIIPVVRETERLKAKARLNGHYKNVIPPGF